MKYSLSKFSHIYSHKTEEIDALWHSLTMELFFLDRSIAQTLNKTRHTSTEIQSLLSYLPGDNQEKQKALESLIDAKMLISEEEDEKAYPTILATSMEQAMFIGVLYLMLFDGCNFKCSYCFENVREPKGFRPMAMPQGTVEAGLNLFAELYRKYPPPSGHEPKVQLYGGEPLINKEAFIHAVEYFNKLQERQIIDSRVGLATVTNGSMITEELASFISKKGVSVGVSLDGPLDINNLYRKSAQYNPFHTAVEAIKLLRKANAKVGVSVTLTSEVVANFERVLSFLQHEIGVNKGLGFNILHYTKDLPVASDYYDKAAECIIEAYRAFRELGVWEDRAMRKVMSFIDKTPLHGDCAAIGHQIVISPDGAIGICQDFIKDRSGFRHSVFDKGFDPFSDQEFVEWSRRSPFRMEQCYDCPALSICGGGCPASAEAMTGSLWSIDKRICPHSRKTLEFLIWDTYGQQKKLSKGR